MGQYIDAELTAVRKTTFMFMPQGSLVLDEPPYSQMDAELVGELNKFLFLNAGLGNRCPTKTGIKFKTCVPCALKGITTRLNEIHLLLVCPRYDITRELLGLVDVVRDTVQSHGEGAEGYAAYWGKGYSLDVSQLRWRLQCAVYLRDIYLEDIVALKPIYFR